MCWNWGALHIRITMIYDQCNIIHVALNETKFKKKCLSKFLYLFQSDAVVKFVIFMMKQCGVEGIPPFHSIKRKTFGTFDWNDFLLQVSIYWTDSTCFCSFELFLELFPWIPYMKQINFLIKRNMNTSSNYYQLLKLTGQWCWWNTNVVNSSICNCKTCCGPSWCVKIIDKASHKSDRCEYSIFHNIFYTGLSMN